MYRWAVSNLGTQTDAAFMVTSGVCLFFFVLITALMVYFSVRYSRDKNPVAEHIEGSRALEITWTVVPIVIVIALFFIGAAGYTARKDAPEGAFTVNVGARMWSWSFVYANGKQSDALNIPVNRPVRLLLKSNDVIHSFSAPAFRVKGDVLPGGRTVTLWFTPTQAGTYDLFCTELCGIGHYTMLSKINVMDEKAFNEWYNTPAAQ